MVGDAVQTWVEVVLLRQRTVARDCGATGAWGWPAQQTLAQKRRACPAAHLEWQRHAQLASLLRNAGFACEATWPRTGQESGR